MIHVHPLGIVQVIVGAPGMYQTEGGAGERLLARWMRVTNGECTSMYVMRESPSG